MNLYRKKVLKVKLIFPRNKFDSKPPVLCVVANFDKPRDDSVVTLACVLGQGTYRDAPTFMWQTGGLPVLHWVTIVKLLTQHVVKGDSWISTNGSPRCWWWGYLSFMTGSKRAAVFSLV